VFVLPVRRDDRAVAEPVGVCLKMPLILMANILRKGADGPFLFAVKSLDICRGASSLMVLVRGEPGVGGRVL
jgi:hypothetical protein